jgi:hypothetical protein
MDSEMATAPQRGLPVDDERPTIATATRRAVERSGGWTGIALASAPTVAFVIATAIAGLTSAFITLAVAASVAFGVRLVRWESLRTALIGLVVAAGCALVAALTGEARGFFLVPTLLPAGWVLVFLGSVLVGRPLTGIGLNRLARGPRNWRQHPRCGASTTSRHRGGGVVPRSRRPPRDPPLTRRHMRARPGPRADPRSTAPCPGATSGGTGLRPHARQSPSRAQYTARARSRRERAPWASAYRSGPRTSTTPTLPRRGSSTATTSPSTGSSARRSPRYVAVHAPATGLPRRTRSSSRSSA